MHVRIRFSAHALIPVLALAACRADAHDPTASDLRTARPAADPVPLRPIADDTVLALLPPVEIHAAGEPIDVSTLVGYPGPAVRDHDGDGRPDLYVGSFAGKIQLFQNVGSRTAPAFARGEFLRTGGEDIKISNW